MWQVASCYFLPLQYIQYLGSKYKSRNLFQASLGNDYLYEVSRGVLHHASLSNKDSYSQNTPTQTSFFYLMSSKVCEDISGPDECIDPPDAVTYGFLNRFTINYPSEWQLAELWWDDIIIQMGKNIPEFNVTVQRTWDGSKALQTSYVSSLHALILSFLGIALNILLPEFCIPISSTNWCVVPMMY